MEKKKRIFIGKREREIIRFIAKGVLISASLAIPNLPVALKPFLETNQKKRNFKRSFNQLYEKDVIYLSGDKICLSKKGKKLLAKIESENITLQEKDWDGIWRIVAYDIPDKSKRERDYFKKKLKELGFQDLQKSMMVTPYECKEEIAVFTQNIGISPYVMFLTTDHLPRQKEMVRKFGLDN
ncbi:MAG: hypothetical protein M1355_01860 [Patescibacteria group bacterium]|nr:hypothetical protein [Patescibacteria group bacterium]